VRGRDGPVVRGGAGDVPVAVGDRGQCPAEGLGVGAAGEAAAGAAVVGGGDRAGAAERGGVAPVRGAVDPRRGGRLIRRERGRRGTLLHWGLQVIEGAFGTTGERQTERQVCSGLLN
jgi:hypothetical protein